MKRSPAVLRAGTRPSSLALTQSRSALDRIEGMLEGVSFEMVPITSTGDTDRTTDLRESPADFFTRELDGVLLRGDVDMAVHSAKDLPAALPAGIDWFWLPWREEPRDALILAKDREISDLPGNPVIGVSSQRREQYCTKRFPNGIQRNIRGNIEERIARVDSGDYDIVVMAAAALHRLNIEERITEWIPLEELEVPEAQGYLAVTFREGDERMAALRSLFMHAVTFAGAGVSNKDLCTVAALRALKQCDICLYDSLIDKTLLDELPPRTQIIDVGKRCGAHSKEQHETTKLICECARQSKRVVRLKGGDPGIFGRLAEETEALESLGIPFRVIPGISALQAATTGTGMLLTRRNVSRGFVALTPRQSGGALARCDAEMKNLLPVIYYMSIRAIEPIAQQLLEGGRSPDTPAAVIYNAGGEDELIFKTTLGQLPAHAKKHCIKQPGLIMVGTTTAYGYRNDLGALQGKKILLTCSEAIQQKAADLVRDLGGQPIQFPLIKLKSRFHVPLECSKFDWLAVSSPSSVRAFMSLIEHQKTDYRTIPKIMVCGRGTANEFADYGIRVDAQPNGAFSAESLKILASEIIQPGETVLRVRSDKAGPDLANALRSCAAEVEDAIIYDNVRIDHETLPDFDAVFFASASGVESFIAQWGVNALGEKNITVIGKPTSDALEKHNLQPDVLARVATVPGAIRSLAEHFTAARILS
ncbi:uroporphyrinogen-III C-methyltransferase [Pontiella sulfatireligans]|uniref:Hydroxymethylbilane synthase n=1 Tax=Pontiella sulfatireligans TaxID=2750658 RepID=A0A6C2USW7_9BACT|nr:uroporphyrinogen-III C-methyltransferase [Pontiella sulfatireligans]VGO22351.1 Uroporphyrinogen-III C-methyltransferase [Pontiella sulfatireligans]